MGTLKTIIPSRRTENIAYAIRDIVCVAQRRADEGKDLIYLNIGDPIQFGFKTPRHMIEATYKAMLENHTGYSASDGVPDAVEAIKAEARKKGIRPYDVIITTGASEAIDFALSALVNKGENVLVPSPGYPLYNALLSRLIGEPRPYILDEENGWQPNIDHMASQIDDKTRAIVLINPNNPTGAVYSEDTLRQVVELARQHNLVIFSDEIYDKLILNGAPHISPASIDPEVPVLTFNGLSKCYLAPGFRVGWMIISGIPELIEPYTEAMRKLARARLCASHPKQFAIPTALNGNQSHLPEVIETLRRRRDLTVERLNAIPRISCQKPDGAFYAFPRLDIDESDKDFVIKLIQETGVVAVHGKGFGDLPESPHMRVVFLPDDEMLNKAYDRIEEFIRKHYV